MAKNKFPISSTAELIGIETMCSCIRMVSALLSSAALKVAILSCTLNDPVPIDSERGVDIGPFTLRSLCKSYSHEDYPWSGGHSG